MDTSTSTTDILDALGIDDLSEKEQEAFLLDIGDIIYQGTLMRAMQDMDEESKDAFEALLARDPADEEMERFMEEHMPTIDQAAAETITQLRDDILAITGASQD